MNSGISIGKGILWVLVWFGFMFIYTALDIVIWRKIAPNYSRILNIITVALSMVVFFVLLERKENFKLNLLENISIQGIVIAICCSVLFYLLLDKGLDPIFESIFSSSKENYQQTIQSIISSPIVSLIDFCRIFNEGIYTQRFIRKLWNYCCFTYIFDTVCIITL